MRAHRALRIALVPLVHPRLWWLGILDVVPAAVQQNAFQSCNIAQKSTHGIQDEQESEYNSHQDNLHGTGSGVVSVTAGFSAYDCCQASVGRNRLQEKGAQTTDGEGQSRSTLP
eukprot:gb/GECG01009951.1/.p1 GENE.gb/GECG01009951.1/~~gb/GECG01009951.1/.p1  ORF type:complete len:114 (+),score=15.06 gb/GECG01009951.1/:1-342(+)